MNMAFPRKSVGTQIIEIFFFFVLIPAILLSMIFHVGEGGVYLQSNGKTLALAATAEDFLLQFPDIDISYQLKFAVDYVRDGSIADWVLNLWPPGMPALYGLMLKFGGSTYFPLKMIALSTFLYSLASYSVYQSLACGRFSTTYLALCALPLAFLTFQDSIFLGISLFSSDFYCFALLAILLSLMFGGPERALSRLAMMAIVLAALAYFRSFYFIFIKLFTVGSLFTLIVWGVYATASGGWRATIKEVVQSKTVVTVGVVLLLTWTLLIPWKAYLVIHEKNFEWTVTDQAWAAQWRNDLPPFLVGMNTPCILEKDICEQLMPFQYPDTWATPKLGTDFYKRLSIATFVSSPLLWYQEKAKIFRYFWFDELILSSTLPKTKPIQDMQSAVLLAVFLGLSVLGLARVLRNYYQRRPLLEKNGLYFLFLIFCFYNLMVFTFVHFEARYSIPLKWVSYLFLLLVLKDIIQKIDLRFSRNRAQKGIA